MRKNWRALLLYRYQKFTSNPYQHLLLSLISLFFAFAFLDNNNTVSIITFNALYLLTVLFVIETFNLSQRILNIFRAIAVLSFSVNSYIILFLQEEIWFANIANRVIQLLFITGAVWIILKRIFKNKHVSGDTLTGGISVYLMLGLTWFQIYQIIIAFDPNTFSQEMTFYRTFYFSFVTLTTVGYGDIVPTHRVAMIFANMEAIIGQMYPAVILARLVSTYVQEREEKRDSS